MSTTFPAKYAGICGTCSSPINPGEEITRTLKDDYTHVECPEPELDALKGRPACPSCWMVGPCDCD
ncbi:hypothetical protein [Arthrobacter bambusae]|uniref:Uncharacterized protein n=1 Tax=Arthrobacter bambusae TaxID=1338426 RepID=A0AAW8DDP2_9MICC|nr:hypothetical protein [Arthrobacter bambusae]MDP9903194.1 hypothetical protein [Arthrobacter bambusae]MDQ0128812.1 hypothetical protein [Arthrobacter bambusae]MDQ0180153.1 hypothetical protein [Arthrobacter bambusae]